MYPDQITAPMREQITSQGFTELTNAEDATKGIQQKGRTKLLFTTSNYFC